MLEFLKNWFYLTVELLIVALVVVLIIAMCIVHPAVFFIALGLAGLISGITWFNSNTD